MEGKVKDQFGYDNQGKNYDIYRPKYPSEFIEAIKEFCDKKEAYLDVASGTGIMFFELIKEFSKHGVLNDRSAKQLDVAREKLKTFEHSAEIQAIECDGYEIAEKLSPKGLKFDLVTFAQAFHWFDAEKMIQYLKDEILAPDGVLAISGYATQGIDYNYYSEDPEFSQLAQTRHDEFLDVVVSHFEFDMRILRSGYATIDFESHFEKVERKPMALMKYEMTLEETKKYFGTYSAYNIYVEKNKSQPSFEDPLEKLMKRIEQDLLEHSRKTNSAIKEKPIVLKQPFSLVLAKTFRLAKKLI